MRSQERKMGEKERDVPIKKKIKNWVHDKGPKKLIVNKQNLKIIT